MTVVAFMLWPHLLGAAAVSRSSVAGSRQSHTRLREMRNSGDPIDKRDDGQPPEFSSEQDSVLWELLDGNRKYVKWLQDHENDSDEDTQQKLTLAKLKQISYLQYIEEDNLGEGRSSLRRVRPKALTISCARSFAPMDHVFSVDSRALMSVRVAGYTCAAADSIIGSVEYELEANAPPILMVVGNARNDIIAAAVRQVRVARAPTMLSDS